MKIIIYLSESNSLIYLIYIYIKIKTEKFTGPNKVLLVLGRMTGAHHEDCGQQKLYDKGQVKVCSS